ncbi:unnamed protein product, partial [Prorocentrum cordatum]
GRFVPSVVTYACRLNLYSTFQDLVRLGLEALFFVLLLLYLAEEVIAVNRALKGGRLKQHMLSLWHIME